MANNYLKKGTWNAICDICGRRFKNDQLRRMWNGWMVCDADYNERHPLDFIRSKQMDLSVPWTRPEPADNFVTVNYIFMPTTPAISGIAISGTCQSGVTSI